MNGRSTLVVAAILLAMVASAGSSGHRPARSAALRPRARASCSARVTSWGSPSSP